MSDIIDKEQKIILEYLFGDKEAFIKAHSILKHTYFDPPLDRVVRFCTNHFSEYHNIPDQDILEAKTDVSLTYRDVDDSERHWLLDEVEEFCSKQAMSAAILESVDLVESGDLTAVQQLVRDALTVRIDKQLGIDFFEEVRDRIERTRISRTGYSLGINALDSINGGQWYRGELYLAAAGTSTGKSVVLANITDRLARQKLDCAIISVEMDEDPYSVRMDSIISGLKIGKSDVDQLVESLDEKAKTYGRITIKRVNNKFGTEDLRAYLMEYHLQYGKYPDALMLDYIDIFANGSSLGKMDVHSRDEIKTHTIRDILIEFDMLGFSACQLNRDSYSDVINISVAHIAGGLSKANGADGVFAMVATDDDIDNNQLQVKGLKVRNAEKSTLMSTLYRCSNTLRVSDTPFGSTPKPKPAFGNNNSDVPLKGKDKLKAALSNARK